MTSRTLLLLLPVLAAGGPVFHQDLRGEKGPSGDCVQEDRAVSRAGPPQITERLGERQPPCAGVKDSSCAPMSAQGQPSPDRITAAAVAGGRLVLLGDWRRGDPAVYLYDPSADQWTQVQAPRQGPNEETLPSLLLSYGEQLLFVPGGAAPLALLDPVTGAWTQLGSLPSRPWGGRQALLGDWLVFADARNVARQQGWAYNIQDGRVLEIPQRSPTRTAPAQVLDGPGWFLWGGYEGADPAQVFTDGLFFDLAAGDWRPVPPGPPGGYSGDVHWDGQRYILSDVNAPYTGPASGAAFPPEEAWAWDPVSATWEQLLDYDRNALPESRVFRDGRRLGTFDNSRGVSTRLGASWGGLELLPRGGPGSGDTSCAQVMPWKPERTVWTVAEDARGPVKLMESCPWYGFSCQGWYRPEILAIGRRSLLVELVQIQRVDRKSGAWTPIARPRDGAIVASLGDSLVVWGGYEERVTGMGYCCGTAGMEPMPVDLIERSWIPGGYRVGVR